MPSGLNSNQFGLPVKPAVAVLTSPVRTSTNWMPPSMPTATCDRRAQRQRVVARRDLERACLSPASQIPPGELACVRGRDERAAVGREREVRRPIVRHEEGRPEAFRLDRGADRLQGDGVSNSDRRKRGEPVEDDERCDPSFVKAMRATRPVGSSASCARVRASTRATSRRCRTRASFRPGCTRGSRPSRSRQRLPDLARTSARRRRELAVEVADRERRPVRAERDCRLGPASSEPCMIPIARRARRRAARR